MDTELIADSVTMPSTVIKLFKASGSGASNREIFKAGGDQTAPPRTTELRNKDPFAGTDRFCQEIGIVESEPEYVLESVCSHLELL
jgi:hypothetical protein